MEPQVRDTLAALYRTQTGMDESAASAWLAALAANGRYVLDVWAAT